MLLLTDSAMIDAMYEDRYLPDNFRLSCVNYELWDKDQLAIAAMDRGSIIKSTAIAKSWNGSSVFGACYVVGLDGLDRCKIGFTVNPLKRLEQLKVGLWETPKFHSLFWSHHTTARMIEYRALTLAKKLGHRLKGEWVGLGAKDATRVVVDAIWGETPFTDSSNFMREWAPAALSVPLPRRGGASVSVDAFYEWASAKEA